MLAWCALGVVFFVFCKKKYKESFGTLVELISDEDAATLMPEADEVELDKVIDAAIDRVLAGKPASTFQNEKWDVKTGENTLRRKIIYMK